MIQVDYSLLLQILNFVVLIFVLDFLLYKPLLSILDKRKMIIEEGQVAIDRLEQTVTEKMAVYEQKVQATRMEALGKNKEVIKEGAEQAKIIIEEAGKELTAITGEFHGRMQKEVLAASDILSKRSPELAREIAEKVLGRRLQ